MTDAICWYDQLCLLVTRERDNAIRAAHKLPSEAPVPTKASRLPDPYLVSKCPACFSANVFGRSISEGCDIHVCLDGCFSHRHLKHAGDGPHPHEPEHYVSKEDVDAVGANISKVRKKPAKQRKSEVPDEAIDECENGHIAGTGTKVKTDPDRFDDTGTMALVCRHDIPILLANIDTPGEQQNTSQIKYDILSPQITNRLTFATSIMHSYVHQWACQLAYNPRFRNGLGLTDGEGVERYWSRMRKIISRTRRRWLIDRLTHQIASESRDNLGTWMTRRFHDLDSRIAKYKLQIAACGIPEAELRELWKEQRAAQISVRAHAPTKLKKDLDRLIGIQGDLDRIESTIKEATAHLRSGPGLDASLKELTLLSERLSEKLNSLYASLNITESFPTLQGLPFEVVHKLLLARDLKINIRKRAIGSFFENERLEQATGGRNEALGTKEHQRVRTAIEKRKPPFLSAIRRFNKLCAELQELLKPEGHPGAIPAIVHLNSALRRWTV
ncbi:hypothetical protein MD484_g7823, partial [Candolleomyces efflorescens]